MIDIIEDKYGEQIPIIKVLDNGFVELIDCMPRLIKDDEESADYVIAEAARCSYQRGTKTIADDKTLIRYLMRHNHTSPFEMIEFKFHMKLPLFIARQVVRTRTANLNELSGRYSEMPEEYYIPEPNNVRTQSKINKQSSGGVLKKSEAEKIINKMKKFSFEAFDLYNDLLNDEVVREQSRMVLPLNTYTEWFWKIDLKNLLHFLGLRCDNHSQWEIQQYANAILELIKLIVPWTIEAWEEYSPYRGGMILTRYEIEAIKKKFSNANISVPEIKVEGELEKKEWKEKAKKLGFEK